MVGFQFILRAVTLLWPWLFASCGEDAFKRRLTLNDGTQMPMVGLGVWLSRKDEVEEAVYHAICNAGYRHIDAAQIYKNHIEVGRALKRAFENETCGVSRQEVWVTSKVWNVDFHPEHVPLAVDRILDELGLEYVDQVLLHWPTPYKKPPLGCPPTCPDEFSGTDDSQRPRGPDGHFVPSSISLAETWQALERTKIAGKTRSIGVSNFGVEEIQSLFLTPATTVPAVNQVECHVFWRQDTLRQSLKQLGIATVAYSPLGNPARYADQLEGMSGSLIQDIAAETASTPAQVMLSFLLQQDVIVIPKSVTLSRIDTNIKFSPKLTAEHMAKLTTAPQKRLTNPPNRPGGKPVFMDNFIDKKEL